jgi:hypothetical protein
MKIGPSETSTAFITAMQIWLQENGKEKKNDHIILWRYQISR